MMQPEGAQRPPMIPFVEVSHLPSSTSFYSAILQPLGLQYIQGLCSPNSDRPPQSYASSLGTQSHSRARIVSFGEPTSPGTPVLQVRETTGPSKVSRVVLSAPSPAAVADFQACAARASLSSSNTNACQGTCPLLLPAPANSDIGASLDTLDTLGSVSRAKVTDFDGNIMEVIYPGPTQYPADYRGPVVRRTQSTKQEVGRILDWNYDVARSSPSESVSGTPASRSHARQADSHATVLRKSITTSTYEYPARQESSGQGVSTGAVAGLLGVGMAVGMGVGAALTYSSMKSDRSRAPMHEVDAPVFQRRSTYPERLPSERGGRYVEVERTMEKVRYPEDHPAVAGSRAPSQLQYSAAYSQAGSTMAMRSRAADDMHDGHSRHSTRYQGSRTGTVRTRSEAPEVRAPLLLTEAEHRSHVSSKSRPSGSHVSHVSHRPPHQSTVVDAEAASYASGRSHRSSGRSSATVRPPAPPPAAPSSHITEVISRSRAGSRMTATTTVKVPALAAAASQVSRPPNSSYNASRSGSRVSARQVPLPRSSMASSHESAWVDEVESVAPSDSISCAGSRRRSHAYVY